MKFRMSGTHDPEALEILRTIQPMEYAMRSPLSRLDFLLGFVKKHSTETVEQYVVNLQERYEELTTYDTVVMNAIDIDTLISQFSNLKKYPGLAMNSLNYFLQLLQLPKNMDLENSSFEVTQRIQLQAFLYPKYQNLFTLTETMGREKAIEIYKDYHDAFMRKSTNSQNEIVESLDELAEQWFRQDAENRGLVRIVSEVVNGKLYLRKDTCLWNDAIKELEDRELKYYICCFGDFDSVKRRNTNFEMTMEHTIVEGYPFCDCVFHDTRINADLSHPSTEFFESMEVE